MKRFFLVFVIAVIGIIGGWLNGRASAPKRFMLPIFSDGPAMFACTDDGKVWWLSREDGKCYLVDRGRTPKR